jgi:hypothetical protein
MADKTGRSDQKSLAAQCKFYRRQETLAGCRKGELCIDTFTVILAGYPPPNEVAQFHERRRIEELVSEFAAFAAELLGIPSHQISVPQSIDPGRNIPSIQSEKGI